MFSFIVESSRNHETENNLNELEIKRWTTKTFKLGVAKARPAL